MPELVGCEHLIELLYECGPYTTNGMGPTGLEWPDIWAWSDICYPELQPWEAKAIKRLSAEYAGQLHAGSDPNAFSPYQPETVSKDRQKEIESKLQLFARYMAADPSNPGSPRKRSKKPKTQP